MTISIVSSEPTHHIDIQDIKQCIEALTKSPAIKINTETPVAFSRALRAYGRLNNIAVTARKIGDNLVLARAERSRADEFELVKEILSKYTNGKVKFSPSVMVEDSLLVDYRTRKSLVARTLRTLGWRR